MLKCQSLEKLHRGDIKVMELVAGLGSNGHVGALVPVGAHVLALLRAAKSESTDSVEKNTC